jgi:1-acyl-sn-glycerol-3-phosphate acyltransferase
VGPGLFGPTRVGLICSPPVVNEWYRRFTLFFNNSASQQPSIHMSRTAFEPSAAETAPASGGLSPTSSRKPSVNRLVFPPEVVNPFVNDIKAHSSLLQKAKMVILGVTIFPIRVVGLVTFILIAWLVSKIAILGYSEEYLRTRPIKEGVFKRLVYACARCCMFFFGYQWLESDNRNWALRLDGSHKEAPIIVANHSNVCDGFLLYYTHGLHSVGVDSVAEAPFFSSYAKAAQAFSLNRDDPDGRKKIAAEMMRRALWTDQQAQTIGRWNPITMFAEGTCTNQKSLIQFRHGAFSPGVPVQPMIIRYPFRHCDQSWCGLENPGSSLLRIMCQFHNRLQYSYLPVYEPSEEEKRDPYLFAENVRTIMSIAMCVPKTEHTFEDMRVAAYAQKLGLPWRNIHCEMGYFRSHGSTFEKAKVAMKRFAEADHNKDGYLSKQELGNAMNLGAALNALVDAFLHVWTNGACNDESCGGVSFRHFYFMTGLRLIRGAAVDNENASPSSPEVASPVPTSKPPTGGFIYEYVGAPDHIRVAHDLIFEQLDADGDGIVCLAEFEAAMRRTLPTLSQANHDLVATALCDLYASVTGASKWDRNCLDQFLDVHPLMAEHLLATLF